MKLTLFMLFGLALRSLGGVLPAISFEVPCAGFSNSLYAQYTGKTNASTEWTLWQGAGDNSMLRNPSCWVSANVSFSGTAEYNEQVHLITPASAVAAHHMAFAAQPTNWFRGDDGGLYAARVVSRTNVIDDIDIITFAAPLPPAVKPYMVLRTNSIPRLCAGILSGCWYRRNTGHINAVYWFTVGRDIGNASPVPGAEIFYDGSTTGSDSSDPLFVLATNQAVFLGCVQGGLLAPFISSPGNWSAIATVVPESQVNWLSLYPAPAAVVGLRVLRQ